MKIDRYKKRIALLLIFTIVFTIVFPLGTLAESTGENESEEKYIRAVPSVFNPAAGQEITIEWIFEVDHDTIIKIYKNYIDDNDENLVYQSSCFSHGGYSPNYWTWDGKGDDGETVSPGKYVIKLIPNDEFSEFALNTSFGVTTSAAKDIEIEPNLQDNEFEVHGALEENTSKVEIFIDGESEGIVDVEGDSSGEWQFYISLSDYEIQTITAEKTNIIQIPVVDDLGEPVLDENGEPEFDEEEETVDLGPIIVLKHILRPHDRLTDMASHYYDGDYERYTEIVEANELEYPYLAYVGNNLLVLEPEEGGEPPSSERVEPEDMYNHCGLIDLATGDYAGDPVNAATGNYIYSHNDISVNGSFPISFKRFYNSRDHYNGDIGTNWHHSLETRLQDMNGGTIEAIFDDGHREIFTASGSGKYSSEPGKYRDLRKNNNGSYTLTLHDKSVYNFNERGQLTETIDINGNSTTYDYEDLLLRKVESPSGYLLIQYYNNGYIRKISDSTGRYVEYMYTGKDLTSFRDVEGNIIEYKYDSQNRMTDIISPRKDGSIANRYDSDGRVIEQTLADGNTMYFDYDDANRTTTLTGSNGSKTIYKYDEEYRITEIVYEDGVEKFTFNDENQRTSYIDKNGSIYYYDYDDNGNVISVKDPKNQITEYSYDDNNKVTLIKLPDSSIYSFTYDSKGNMLTSTDPTNRTTRFEYNSKGLPIKVINPDDNITELSYDNKGNLEEVKDPLGNKIKYQYDSLNRMKSVTDPNGNRTDYEYTDAGEIRKVTDAEGNSASYKYNVNGKLEEVKDPYGRKTSYEFNEGDQLIHVTDQLGRKISYEYDESGNIKRVIDKNGKATEYEYDSLNRVISVKDPESYTTAYEYDANGNMLKSTDARDNATIYKYDELNRLITATDAGNAETKYEYDMLGRVVKVTDAQNHSIEYEYDEAGRIVQITDPLSNTTTFAYNALGLVETVTDAEGATTEYQYDPMGQITEMTDAEGARTQWEYDKNGNVTKVIDALGNKTKYTYDKINRVKTIEDAKGNVQSYKYTKTGEVKSVTDAKGNKTEYEYDELGQLIEVIDANGHSTEYVYDNMGNLIEVHRYRSINDSTADSFTVMNIQTVTDAVYGQQTVVDAVYGWEAEAAGGIDMESQALSAFTNEGMDQTVADAVYGQGTSLSIKNFKMQSSLDTEHQVTTYEYDSRGLLTKVIDAAGKATMYEYDGNGNLISVKDRDGYTTSYEYGPTDLLKQITYDDEKEVRFDYNAIGQLIEMRDWLGTTSMDLDPLGRVMKVIDFEDRVTEYGWTPTGQKEFIKYPDGSQVTYAYDKASRMTGVTDAAGNTTQYKYNELGSLIERELPNGSSTQYEYDALSQLTQLAQINPAGRITDIYEYDYDEAGNKIKAVINRTELDSDDIAEEQDEDGEADESFTYKYSPLNQLIEVSKNNEETRKYFYDTVGNRVRLEEYDAAGIKGAVNYQYDELDRLVRTFEDAAVNEDNNKQYLYDNRGNLIQTKAGDKIFNDYSYDETNRLVEVINKHKDITSYIYDGFGNRVAQYIDLETNAGGNRPGKGKGHAYGHDKDKHGKGKAIGHGKDNNGNPHPGWGHQYKRDSMEIKYVVDITKPYDNVLMMYGDHYQVQRYTRGIDTISVDQWELEDPNNGWIPDTTGTNLEGEPDRLYYLQDEMGSITKVIGEDGKTSAHYNYDEFGRPLSFKKFDQNWPGPDNTFGYTGYQYDVYAGLWYAQARYYMPETGRFISEDPWPGDMTVPQTLNPYPYVVNNPLKYVDPLGLKPPKVIKKHSRGPSADTIDRITEEVASKKTNKGTEWSKCSLSSEQKYQNLFDEWIKTAPDKFEDLGALDYFKLRMLREAINNDISTYSMERLDEIYLEEYKYKAQIQGIQGVALTLWGAAKAYKSAVENSSTVQTSDGTGKTDILSGKTLTNQTGKVNNYVSEVKGNAAAQADFYAKNPSNVRTYSNGTVVGDLPDGTTINMHPSTSLAGTPTVEIYNPNTGISTKIRY